jgi:UDP-glucose 4-epimerase
MLLVTGAAGYIGSHFVRECLAERSNLAILAVDNLSTGHRESLPDSFAANCYVGESESDPYKYLTNNVVKTISLLQSMTTAGVKRLVFSSSCATYGEPETMPITEAAPQKPINVYGQTKFLVEQILQTLHRKVGLSYVALCYFNAAGAHPSGEIGESHSPEPHLIPNVLASIANEQDILEVFGDDYDTHDGTCVRDYVHVCDLARAHFSALQLTSESTCARRINLGTGVGASVNEVIKTCEQISGKRVQIKISKRRPGDPAALVADYTLARDLLKWEPQHDLASIIESAWRWQQNKRY